MRAIGALAVAMVLPANAGARGAASSPRRASQAGGSVPEQLVMTWPCPQYTFPAESTWTLLSRTAAGSPIWVNHGFSSSDAHAGHYLFHDPDCDGGDGGATAAWLIAPAPPDTCLERDLDSDGTCSGHGAVGSVDTSLPPSGNWIVYCCAEASSGCQATPNEVTFTVPSSFNTSAEIATYSPQAKSLPCATNTQDCCGMQFNSDAFAKCNFWGDPHWSKSFGHGRFDMQGNGAFQVASSIDGEFEVQDIQCPWRRRQHATVAVGIAVKMHATRIAVHQNFLYVNGTKVTESTASLLDGLNVAGDVTSGGVLIQSDDCCYRASVTVRAVQHSPGFYHNLQVRVLDDRAAGTGVCGAGPSYNTLVGDDDMLFDHSVLPDICEYCTEKPVQCTRRVPSPEPSPIPSPAELTPEALCAEAVSDGGCGEDPFAQARVACAALNGSEYGDGCMVDYCLAGCDQEMADLAEEESVRTPPDSIDDEEPPVIPRNNEPGIATVPPTLTSATRTTLTRTTTSATSLTITDTTTTRTATTRTTGTKTTTSATSITITDMTTTRTGTRVFGTSITAAATTVTATASVTRTTRSRTGTTATATTLSRTRNARETTTTVDREQLATATTVTRSRVPSTVTVKSSSATTSSATISTSSATSATRIDVAQTGGHAAGSGSTTSTSSTSNSSATSTTSTGTGTSTSSILSWVGAPQHGGHAASSSTTSTTSSSTSTSSTSTGVGAAPLAASAGVGPEQLGGQATSSSTTTTTTVTRIGAGQPGGQATSSTTTTTTATATGLAIGIASRFQEDTNAQANTTMVIVILLAAMGLCCLCALCKFWCAGRRRKDDSTEDQPSLPDADVEGGSSSLKLSAY